QHVDTAQQTVEREVPLPDRSSLLLARQFLPPGSTPSRQLARRELAQRVRQALTQLAEADPEILFLRAFHRLSHQEIGSILELEPATVSKRHGRALLRLHAILAEGGLTESQV